MGFSKQEYWSGLPFTPPGDVPNPGMEPMYPMANTLQVDSFMGEPPGKPLTFLKMGIVFLLGHLVPDYMA